MTYGIGRLWAAWAESPRPASAAMSESPSSTALPRPGGPGGLRPRRPVRLLIWLGVVALLAVAALVAAAVIPGSHHSGADSAVAQRAVAAPTASSDGARAGEEGVRLLDLGQALWHQDRADGERVQRERPGPDLSPVSVWRSTTRWRVYRALRGAMGGDARPRRRAADRRAARRQPRPARRDWETAFSDYLHLGAVYGLLPGPSTTTWPGMPGEIGDPHFVGLHRIEMGLWTHQPVRSLAPLGIKLSSTVDRLRAELPTAAMNPQSTACGSRAGSSR